MAAHSAPGVIISLAQSLTTAATAPQPAITPTEEHMQAVSPMETWGSAPTRDDLYTERMQPHRSAQSTAQTSVYMRVWLAPHQPSGWAVISERTVSSWKQAPRSSSLSLCISVSPHHSGGRPTKAFVSQRAVQQNLHKDADSILLTGRRGKEIEESRDAAETEDGREIQLWKKEDGVKGFALCVCLEEWVRWIEVDTEVHGGGRAARQAGGPAPREMTVRRGCVGLATMDGCRDVGCRVTWWRELSSAGKTQDLGAVSCREGSKRQKRRWEGYFNTLSVVVVFLRRKKKANKLEKIEVTTDT